MPSSRSPSDMSWYSAIALRTFTSRFSIRTPVWIRSIVTIVPMYQTTKLVSISRVSDRVRGATSELQRLPVAGQLEITAADPASGVERAHCSFPVDRADAGPRIELLIVHERLQHAFHVARADAHRNRVINPGARRAPPTLRHELNLGRRKVSHTPIRRAMAAARPKRGAGPVAHAKRHQRAAVVEVDADPIPAGGVGRHILARPFVIEPGCSGNGSIVGFSRDLPRHGELRLAVVRTRLTRTRALA